jgi:antibiotic biosynthesis monooxygenase (ABM) superfamily enzyme
MTNPSPAAPESPESNRPRRTIPSWIARLFPAGGARVLPGPDLGRSRSACATIVIRTRVRGPSEEFEHWQRELGQAAGAFPGFIDQAVLPPSPPEQAHWVTLQWFEGAGDALRWLNSDRRRDLLASASPSLLDPDDIHIVRNDGAGGSSPGASAIITARVRPGCEDAYRAWQQRIAAALSLAGGFCGYRFEPPIPGVQDSWLVVMRFDAEANLEAWLDSPTRKALLDEAAPFIEDSRLRVAGVGLDRWFQIPSGAVIPPAWKMSMLVLLVIYPTVFLFDRLVGTPLLADRGVPPWLALFLGNAACVSLMSWLVPWAGRRFRWWLEPRRDDAARVTRLGVGMVVGLYALWLLAFAAYSAWARPG